jgi:hypothetical protein
LDFPPNLLDRPRISGDVTHDAVVVIPGIMGSELLERDTGRVLWGMGSALAYGSRWGHAGGMAALRVTDGERAGRVGRIVAGGLLRFPAWAPMLGGLEPYSELVRRLRQVVADQAAILEFAYDWRLPVDHNARLLAVAMDRHLTAWREHPAQVRARRLHPSGRDAELVLVAHSMGGLLAQALSLVPGAADQVRAVLTLGTPFHGSVKAVQVLNTGRGLPVPLPRQHLRDLARTLPGLHDLLPTYRCLVRDDDEVEAPSPREIASLGGDEELARRSLELHDRLVGAPIPEHRLLVGVAQPTSQSFSVRDGVVRGHPYGFRRHADGELMRDRVGRPVEVDHGGDGTVYRYAAAVAGTPEIALAQQHGALPRTTSVIDIAKGAVTGLSDLGAVLGEAELGLSVPDAVASGEPCPIVVTGGADPARVTCVVEDAGNRSRIVARPRLVRRGGDDGELSTTVTIGDPGLYRIKVAGGGDPVTQLVLVGGMEGESDD